MASLLPIWVLQQMEEWLLRAFRLQQERCGTAHGCGSGIQSPSITDRKLAHSGGGAVMSESMGVTVM